MLLSEFIKSGCESLREVYSEREARSIVVAYCCEVFGVQSYTHIVEPGTMVPSELEARALSDLSLLRSGRPLQYVLGYAWFCGRRFKVSDGVLIPRPETEEMVQKALEALSGCGEARVLDICTGSGCIAWSIALGAPGSRVTGVDISPEALSVAREQESLLSGEGVSFKAPEFIEADILGQDWFRGLGQFDVLVSNPPYICEEEKARMDRNVLDFEPSLALFVPDSDPLLFYRAIASAAGELLRDGGLGIVEINERFGAGTAELFSSYGFSDATVIQDFNGRDRFVSFSSPHRTP